MSKPLADQPPCANGYVLLISVIILGAIATSIAVTLLFLGSGDSKNAISHQQSEFAQATVNACAEEALEQIRSSTSFTGTNNISINNGSCTYAVTNTGGETRLVTASSTVDGINRHVSIIITAINPKLVVSWQEIP